MKISIDLVANTGQLETDMARAAKTVERRMREIERTAKIAGAAIGAAIVVGVVAIARATIEAEKVQAQLAARIKDTGMAAGRTVEQLNKMADSLQGRTVFDDEAIGGAQAMLLTFKQIQGVQFDATIEAAADLATVMGTDIADAAKLLGKALTEPEEGFGALKKAGVTFKQSQQDAIKAMVETGDVARAQDMILRELESTMGTAAEAARNTLGGALTGLGNDFENLLEGDTGSEGVKGTADAINALGEIMRSTSVKDGFQTMIAGLASIASTAVNAIAQLANMAATLKQTFTADRNKSYQGLLEKRVKLDDRLAIEQGRTLFHSDKVIAGIEAEIAELDELIAVRRALAALPAPGATGPEGNRVSADETITIHGGGFDDWNTQGAIDKAAKAAAREATKFEAERIRMAEAAAEATKDLNALLAEQRAEVGGPLAQAQLAYNLHMERLQEILDANPELIDKVTEAQGLYGDALEKTKAAIEAQLTPAEQLLSDMQFELDLIGKTNAERQTAIDLRNLEGKATDAQAEAVARLNQQIEETRQMSSAMDEFRGNFADTLTDVLKGTASISDAFESMANAVIDQIARMLAEQLTAGLFGQPGSTGGGTAGGFLSQILGAFLPGFASGTDYAPGGWAVVGERGPELVNLPRGSQVVPNHKMGSAGGTNITVNVAPTTERRTAQQVAMRVAEMQRMAMGRA